MFGTPKSSGNLLQRCINRFCRMACEHLWMKVLIGLFLGCATGLLLGPALGYLIPDLFNNLIAAAHPDWVMAPEYLSVQIGHWLALPGYVFLAVLQMD